MNYFYGIIIIGVIFYGIIKLLPDPPKEEKVKRIDSEGNSKSKKKKSKKNKKQQKQQKQPQKIQVKNTPPKGKPHRLDEQEWPTLDVVANESSTSTSKENTTNSKKQKSQPVEKKKGTKKQETQPQPPQPQPQPQPQQTTDKNNNKSVEKPIVIQNVSLPITNRKRIKKHYVDEDQKYISSDDEEVDDLPVNVVRVVEEKKEEEEIIELPPEVDGWKNVVPKKQTILVIKPSTSARPVIKKTTTIHVPKPEPLTKKQKENKKKAEKRKLEKQRERELQEERLRKYKAEQKRLNIGYKYVPPPKPNNPTNKPKVSANSDKWTVAETITGGITSVWGN